MKKLTLLLFTLLALPSAVGAASDPIITKELITSRGKERVYYLYVPAGVKASAPAPLVVLLHGSNRNGNSLAEKWKDLAKKEGFIIAGPDASNPAGWRVPEDGPDFIHELVEFLKTKHPVNARRVYLFGHSAGAGQALYLSLMESEYFAATAIHAGALNEGGLSLIERAERKIPIGIWVGTNDDYFPLPTVRATRDALKEGGIPVELTEIKGHTHWYYDRAPEINRSAWEFLKKHELAEDPRYQQYQFKR